MNEEAKVKGDKVWMTVVDFVAEHERLLKVLKSGPEYEAQKKDLDSVKEAAAKEESKKSKKDMSTMPMDDLRAKLPEAPKPTFQGNLNAY
jgi:hypothetical protein